MSLDMGMTSCGLIYTNSGECSDHDVEIPSLSGKVFDSEGAAIPMADVLLFSNAAAPALIDNIKTNSTGTFAFQDLPAGTYWLEIASAGFTPSRIVLHIRPGTEHEPSQPNSDFWVAVAA